MSKLIVMKNLSILKICDQCGKPGAWIYIKELTLCAKCAGIKIPDHRENVYGVYDH